MFFTGPAICCEHRILTFISQTTQTMRIYFITILYLLLVTSVSDVLHPFTNCAFDDSNTIIC